MFIALIKEKNILIVFTTHQPVVKKLSKKKKKHKHLHIQIKFKFACLKPCPVVYWVGQYDKLLFFSVTPGKYVVLQWNNM